MAQTKKTVAKKQPSVKKVSGKKSTSKKTTKKEKIQDARIILLFDRSGSMESLIPDAIGTYNTFKNQQKALPGKTTWNAFMFDNEYQPIIENADINDVPDLNDSLYFARGTTAYVDALGKTITTFKSSNDPKVKTILAVMTDGYENASKEFSRTKVKELVKEVQEKLNWEVIFFGANIDALGEGDSLGVSKFASASFDFNQKGFSDAAIALNTSALFTRGASDKTVQDYYFAQTGKTLSNTKLKKMKVDDKVDLSQVYASIKEDTEN